MLALRALLVPAVLAGVVAGLEAGAQERTAAPAPGRTWQAARNDALQVRDELLRELSTMRRLRAAQISLEAWNDARRGVGSTTKTLRPEVCEEPEIGSWCLLLPATFGKLEDGL